MRQMKFECKWKNKVEREEETKIVWKQEAKKRKTMNTNSHNFRVTPNDI